MTDLSTNTRVVMVVVLAVVACSDVSPVDSDKRDKMHDMPNSSTFSGIRDCGL